MVSHCNFSLIADCVTCFRCGFKICNVKLPVYRKCDIQAGPGLGDMVAAGLSAIGITEERVSKAIGRPCGCSERAEKLNELGRRVGIG
jgi:hypothetical protein